MLYNNYLTNITGKDRVEMMKVIDNDEAFDRWREEYDRRMTRPAETKASGKGSKVAISKDDFFKQKGSFRPPGA